jgi:hypothetical protein
MGALGLIGFFLSQ